MDTAAANRAQARRTGFTVLGCAALLCAAGAALGEPPHGPHGGGGWQGGAAPRPMEHFDGRFGHNHPYPGRGAWISGPPANPVIVQHRNVRYYYSGGVWYAPQGPRFVVVAPPIGVFVPVLPPYYTTVWFGGIPYYYANDTYYVWRDSDEGYEVVDPPGNDSSASTEAPPSDEDYVYPKNGQSEEQTAQDRYDCHRWAVSQSGFDPTQSGGGVPPDQTASRRTEYHRAFAACLDGRGYSVR